MIDQVCFSLFRALIAKVGERSECFLEARCSIPKMFILIVLMSFQCQSFDSAEQLPFLVLFFSSAISTLNDRFAIGTDDSLPSSISRYRFAQTNIAKQIATFGGR